MLQMVVGLSASMRKQCGAENLNYLTMTIINYSIKKAQSSLLLKFWGSLLALQNLAHPDYNRALIITNIMILLLAFPNTGISTFTHIHTQKQTNKNNPQKPS